MNGVAKNDYSWPHLIRMLIKMFSYHANLFENEGMRSEEHTSELQSHLNLVCRLLLEKKIYSIAWKTTHENYTPMRALVMDFRDDPRVWNIGDQFLFGPSLLVNPVTEPGATSRHLYLPKGKWYNFWNGEAVEGGRATEVAAPLDETPVFVRAGTILPLGAPIEFSQESS